MTAQNRTVNKARFEQGDLPQGSDFADLIDSFLSLVDTSSQTVASNVVFSGGVNIATVSAATLVVENYGNVSANRVDSSVVSAAVLVANEALLIAASAHSFAATSAMVFTGFGIGTVAPTNGIFIASSSESSVSLDVTTTAIASGGTGGAVPASAQGFLIVRINGGSFRIPFFNVK